jgi:hypothetical protein
MLCKVPILEGSSIKCPADDVSVAVGKIVHLFEMPLHGSGLDSPENIKNSFTVFRVSNICVNVWKEAINTQQVQT